MSKARAPARLIKRERDRDALKPPVPKKPKKKLIPVADDARMPFNPEKYFWPQLVMVRLMEQWNKLDMNVRLGVYEGCLQRQEYFYDIKQLMERGEIHNPFGVPLNDADRQDFRNMFEDLSKREQRFFFNLAQGSLQGNHSICRKDIEVFFTSPPEPPLYVQLDKKIEGYQDGSDRFPYDNMEAVEKALRPHHYTLRCTDQFKAVLVTECREDCPKVACAHPRCQKTVCSEHGYGLGMLDASKKLVFPYDKCMNCPKVACIVHNSKRCTMFMDCDVCLNGFLAERSLSRAHDWSPEACFVICDDCGKTCAKRLDDNEKEGDPYHDPDVCGFYCCPRCLSNHQCGYDPSDFC